MPVALAYLSAFLGTIAFSTISMGFLVRRTTWWEWAIAAFGAFLCFFPNVATDIAGVAVVAAVWFWQRYDVRRRENQQVSTTSPA